MASFTDLDNDDIGPDKIFTTGTAEALYENPQALAGREVETTTSYTSPGTTTWNKPSGYLDDDTVLIQTWAGGGGGGGTPGIGGYSGGGAGGGYDERAYRYADVPSSLTVVVGAGGVGGAGGGAGANGTNGGNTTVTGTGVFVGAVGGQGGRDGGVSTGGTCFGALVRNGSARGAPVYGLNAANGGTGNGGPVAIQGDCAIFGGGGGGGGGPGAGGVAGISRFGGDGGDGGDGVQGGQNGTAPGGGGGGGGNGGGATYNGGNGANGQATISIIRGYSTGLFGNF